MTRIYMMKGIIAIAGAAALFACVREPEDIELIRNMVVQTDYNVEEVDGETNVFNDYTTFVLRKDTLGFVSTASRDTILLDNSSTIVNFAKSSIKTVADSAIARGYTRVEESEDPDFAIKIVILENFSYSQYIYYPGYYSGYYGYYGGYYGPIINTYSTNYVTMVIEVVDIKNYAANGNKYKVIWSAYIGDILAAIDQDTRKQKITEAIGQAFQQSPYFSKN